MNKIVKIILLLALLPLNATAITPPKKVQDKIQFTEQTGGKLSSTNEMEKVGVAPFIKSNCCNKTARKIVDALLNHARSDAARLKRDQDNLWDMEKRARATEPAWNNPCWLDWHLIWQTPEWIMPSTMCIYEYELFIAPKQWGCDFVGLSKAVARMADRFLDATHKMDLRSNAILGFNHYCAPH